MVRLISAAPAVAVARQHWPETVITVVEPGPSAGRAAQTAGQVQAWAAGPGLGTDETAVSLLTTVLASDLPVLVDADGITVLAAHRELLPRAAPTLITPHAGELARLLDADRGEIEARRLDFAQRAAAELGLTVLLKGSTTVIASPAEGEPVLVNPTGTAWLATAGSGDVLSGLAGALLAQGLGPAAAAASAAYLHGIAARLAATGAARAFRAGPAVTPVAGAGAPIGASDLIKALPEAIRTVAACRAAGGPVVTAPDRAAAGSAGAGSGTPWPGRPGGRGRGGT